MLSFIPLNIPLKSLLVLIPLLFSAGTRSSHPLGSSASLTPVSQMSKPRADHTSTLLKDGRVLIAGGMIENGVFLKNAEVFSSATRSFSRLPDMKFARVGHSATLLKDGSVLIAGGLHGAGLAASSSEIFDPIANTFHAGPSLATERYGQSAVLLRSGRVLITGGSSLDEKSIAATEIFDPTSRKFTPTDPMAEARAGSAAALLSNGDVLICGGMNEQRVVLATCERFDAKESKWYSSARLNLPRIKHDMVTLADGSVLVIGGASTNDWVHQHDTAEIVFPLNRRTSTLIKMNHKRFKLPDTSVLLMNGSVLVAGGSEYLEVFDPRSGTFSNAPPALAHPIYYARSTRLTDGSVLITGGYGNGSRDNGPIAGSAAWVYAP